MPLSRRDFIRHAPAAGLLPWSVVAAPAGLDFRQGLPQGISFERDSVAMEVGDDGSLSVVRRSQARLSRADGLLIEGELRNLIAADARWDGNFGASAKRMEQVTAPDGSRGVDLLTLPPPGAKPAPAASAASAAAKADANLPACRIRAVAGDGWGSASVWLRADTPCRVRLLLLDFITYQQVAQEVDVRGEWQRFAVSDVFRRRKGQAEQSTKFLSVLAPLDDAAGERSVMAWGAQFESANEPSSRVIGDMRAADIVSFAAAPLVATQGQITLALPQGGRRDAVLIDANGDAAGLRIAYSPSGALIARVAGAELRGDRDATGATWVRLAWSPRGAQLSSASDPARWMAEAVQHAALGAPDCGSRARLGMTQQGAQPLVRRVAALSFAAAPTAFAAAVAAPAFVPQGYRLSFGDDFDDDDVGRINEQATGGRPGAPAWRSRYRHERATIINGEKQVYVDPAYSGSAGRPLGVQPFSLAGGALTISATVAGPEIAPHIGKQRYLSGCITTELTHWQQYGYFEMRARMPRGRGFWPAFWLLQKNGTWPPEIDVVEASGARPMGVHLGVVERGRSKANPGLRWVDGVIDTTDGFHVYSVEWDADDLRFFIDGKPRFRSGAHGLHQPMYLLANLAVGSKDSNWIPDPDDSTPWPGRMQIDYIRAYRRA